MKVFITIAKEIEVDDRFKDLVDQVAVWEIDENGNTEGRVM